MVAVIELMLAAVERTLATKIEGAAHRWFR